jgi:hypothetical protein
VRPNHAIMIADLAALAAEPRALGDRDMHRRFHWLGVVLGGIALAIASTAAFADAYPRTGKLYGTTDADFIEYYCSPLIPQPGTSSTSAPPQSIECQFTKVMVRKKAADGRTCFLYANSYEQIFQLTGDAWVYTIEPAPTDNCGMTYVARFEKDLTSNNVSCTGPAEQLRKSLAPIPISRAARSTKRRMPTTGNRKWSSRGAITLPSIDGGT